MASSATASAVDGSSAVATRRPNSSSPSWTLSDGNSTKSKNVSWPTSSTVEPDFLRSTGYYSGEEPLRPAYFDGSNSDSATFIHRDRVCYLLLTNGSP